MKYTWWRSLFMGAAFFALAGFALAPARSLARAAAPAQGHGHGHDQDDQGDDQDHGHGHGHGHAWGHRDHDEGRYYRGDYDDRIRVWYEDRYREDRLPPGLAKRDRLPPGLERQLYVRGALPPGLRRQIEPCPRDLEERLPPPPPDCRHFLIGGHLVLLNTRTYVVVDIFHFELR